MRQKFGRNYSKIEISLNGTKMAKTKITMAIKLTQKNTKGERKRLKLPKMILKLNQKRYKNIVCLPSNDLELDIDNGKNCSPWFGIPCIAGNPFWQKFGLGLGNKMQFFL